MSPEQCRAARALLGITQNELAAAVRASNKILNGFEVRRGSTPLDVISRSQRYFSRKGITFVFFGDMPAGLYLGYRKPRALPVEQQMTPRHCRVARAWLGWNHAKLSEEAGVSESTIRDFEKYRRVPRLENLVAAELAIKTCGVRFLYDNRFEAIGISVVNGCAVAA